MTRAGTVKTRIVGILGYGMIFSILLLVGKSSVFAAPAKEPLGQMPEPQLIDTDDLAERVAQLEALRRLTKQEDDRNQKTSQLLVQFYSAEYAAIMARISAWASLQYAFFPILVASCAMLTKLDNVRANLRWWAATGVLLFGYLAYQGAMLDTLQKVLFIERYLRPLASRVAGTDRFWVHECIYRQTQVANIFYWKYWPPLICLIAITVVTIYIKSRHGFGGWDYAFALGALLLSAGVLMLTIKGARLEEQITEVCEARLPHPESLLSGEGRPTPVVERTDDARPHRSPPALSAYKEINRLGADITVFRDVVAVFALVVAMISAIVAVLALLRNSRVQKAQFIASLTKDLLHDSEMRKFYYKVDYEKFRFDPTKIAEFKGSEDERRLDALLYQYNMVGRLVRLGVISQEDVEFLLFEIVQVFKNSEVKKYIAWLDTEFEAFGSYGFSQRRRPVDDARWLLEQVGSRASRGTRATPNPDPPEDV